MLDEDVELNHSEAEETDEEDASSDEELKQRKPKDANGGKDVAKASQSAIVSSSVKEDDDDDESKGEGEMKGVRNNDDGDNEEEEESIAVDDDSSTENGEDGHDSDKKNKKEHNGENKETEKPNETNDYDKEEVIECPLIADILVGRGQALKLHPGNQRMVAIIAVHRLRYQDANDEEKKEIIKELTSEVQRGGTRFLKVNDNGTGWMKCTSDEIKAKILECILLGKEDDSDPMARASAAAAEIGGFGAAAGANAGNLPGAASAPSGAGGLSSEQLARLQSLVDPMTASALLRATNLPSGLAAALDPTNSSQGGATVEGNNNSPGAGLAGLAGLFPGGQASLLAELEARRQSQVASASSAGGRINGPPLRTDVVIGKEALLYSQEGNLHLQSLVQASIGQEIIPTEMKRIKAKAIYDRMLLGGARFLMKEVDGSGLWYQLSEAEAQNVVYRGLCEEEKRVQTILLSSLQASSLGAGLPLGLNAANLQLGMLPQLGQVGGDSLLLQNALAGSLGKSAVESEAAQGTEPPKRKYKKRLRRVAEERRKMNLPAAKSSVNSMSQSLSGVGSQDGSETSSERSDDEERNIILKAPIKIRPYDVIMGRGRGSFNHSGNKNLIKIFRESKIPYRNASKNKKIQMARDIVAKIQSQGGRFVKRIDDDNWQIISNKDAYKKVGHGIRDLRDEDAVSVDSDKSASPESKKRKVDEEEVDTESTKHAKFSDERKETSDEIRRIILGEPAPRAEKETTPSSRDQDLGGRAEAAEPEKSHKAVFDDDVWYRGASRKEPEEPSTPSFKGYGDGVQPRSIDVVCGRGKAFNRHPANRKMHDAVSRLKYQYRDATSQTEKSQIAHTVLRTIQDDGGKFLKFDENKREWEELSYKNALKKIYHSIRDSLYNDRSSFGTGEGGDSTIDQIVRRPSASSSKESSKHRKAYEMSRGNAIDDTRERTMQASSQLIRSQQESRMTSGLMGGNGLGHDPRVYQMQQHQQHFMSNYPPQTSQFAMGSDPPYGRMAEYPHAVTYHGEGHASDHVSARGGIHGMGSHRVNSSQNTASRHRYPQSHHYPSMGRRY